MSAARRFFALLFAVAQVSLGAAFAIADARVEARALAEASAPHVESKSSPSCARQHLADCALCRALELSGTPSAAPSLASPAPRAPSTVASRAAGHVPELVGVLPDSRAPPGPNAGAARPGSA